MIQMILFTKQKQTDKENKLMVTKWESRGGISEKFEISRYKLLYVKQINNKDLLCSIGNYTQYLAIIYNGKESEKEYIYIYI